MTTSSSPDPDPSDRLHLPMLIAALEDGYFPMAESAASDAIHWYRPDPRAVMPLGEGEFHVRRSLTKALRRERFEIRFDVDFGAVMHACAQPREDESGTWINAPIRQTYGQLADMGLGHSVEAFYDGQRVGGLYGVALGGAFLAESMYSRKPYASQACLVALVQHLRAQGFTLMDVQFTNPHLKQFGVQEISCDRYLKCLHAALRQRCVWCNDQQHP